MSRLRFEPATAATSMAPVGTTASDGGPVPSTLEPHGPCAALLLGLGGGVGLRSAAVAQMPSVRSAEGQIVKTSFPRTCPAWMTRCASAASSNG
jgi:hypothetical protein